MGVTEVLRGYWLDVLVALKGSELFEICVQGRTYSGSHLALAAKWRAGSREVGTT